MSYFCPQIDKILQLRFYEKLKRVHGLNEKKHKFEESNIKSVSENIKTAMYCYVGFLLCMSSLSFRDGPSFRYLRAHIQI